VSLTPGTSLGACDIITPIGQGGMGQVFRAGDTKLQRDVAIKILPEAFAHDADRLECPPRSPPMSAPPDTDAWTW
jgi:serine/threonine protein kinase